MERWDTDCERVDKVCCHLAKLVSAFVLQYRCFVIYLPILVVGNFIVLNLFLALLLNSFDTEELNAQREVSDEIIPNFFKQVPLRPGANSSGIVFHAMAFKTFVPIERVGGIWKEFKESCSPVDTEGYWEDGER